MNAKTKSFLFNFFSFGLIFITIRLGINYLFPELKFLYASLISGVVSVFIAPRFAAIPTDSGEKVFMKWLFMKGVKEV